MKQDEIDLARETIVHRHILAFELHKNGANNAKIAPAVDSNAYLYPGYTLGPVEHAQDRVSECPVKVASPPARVSILLSDLSHNHT